MATIDPKTLPPLVAERYAQAARRWESAIVADLRFGVSDTKRLTTEAAELAALCRRAKQDATEIFSLHFRSAADRTMTPEAALLRSARFAEQKIRAVKAAWDRTFEAAEDRAKALRAQLDATVRPPSDAGTAMIHSEIRQRVAKMDGVDALKIIRGDPVWLAAVVSAPASLSGLVPEIHSTLQREHFQRHAPDTLAALDDAVDAIKSAERAVREVETEARSYIDFEQAELLSMAAAEAARHG